MCPLIDVGAFEKKKFLASARKTPCFLGRITGP
jgi:hypothetical protein